MPISLYDISIIVLPGRTDSFLIEFVESIQKCRLLSTYCRVELIVWNDVTLNESITAKLNKNLHIKQLVPNNHQQPVYHALNHADGNSIIIIGEKILLSTSTIYKHYVLHQNRKESVLFPTFVDQANIFFTPSLFSFSSQLLDQTGFHLYQTKMIQVTTIPYLQFLLNIGIKFILDQSSSQTIESHNSEPQYLNSIQQLKDIHVKNSLITIDSTQKPCHYERYPLQYEW